MERILIIDDSHMQAACLRSILDEEYDITTAPTAEEGFNYACSGDFSLVLLDVVMPGMNGFMLLKKLQEELVTKAIPVILITSLADIDNEQKGLTLGAVDYITKPFHPLIVKARVDTHVKLYNYRKRAEQDSMTDQLTGAANRRRYELYSEMKWQEAVRLHVPFSVCMFDIDNFKVYNDTFGHPAGDKVITTAAKTIGTYLRRSTDFFARYGGEEFVALLIGDSSDKVYNHMKSINKAVEDLHIPHNPQVSQWVTVSIGGVTVIPKREDSFDTYLRIADAILYDAKKLGRNRVIWANESMRQVMDE